MCAMAGGAWVALWLVKGRSPGADRGWIPLSDTARVQWAANVRLQQESLRRIGFGCQFVLQLRRSDSGLHANHTGRGKVAARVLGPGAEAHTHNGPQHWICGPL